MMFGPRASVVRQQRAKLLVTQSVDLLTVRRPLKKVWNGIMAS